MVNSNALHRIQSIDILRALTMVLMIFVNDLWSLKEIPKWLDHVENGVDGIGLADVVFPAFLFIVGLSIPFAIDNRRKKGDSTWQLIQHVCSRTFALLVMGLFLVNGESINELATGMPSYAWNPICCLCFILIWNSYPMATNKILVILSKSIGILTLLTLAYIYRGGETNQIQKFEPHWWGILGLIGWAYFASGLIAVVARNKFYTILIAWLFFAGLSMAFKAGLIPSSLHFIPEAILGGTLTALTLGGILITLIFQYFTSKSNNKGLFITYYSFSIILILLSIITRPYWGLSKLGATPAWLFLCSAFTILAFTLIYWIADIRNKSHLFSFVKPAGTNTLLCYLIPYFAYTAMHVAHIHLPEIILTGYTGLIKSFLFALLCVFITKWITKAGIRLRL